MWKLCQLSGNSPFASEICGWNLEPTRSSLRAHKSTNKTERNNKIKLNKKRNATAFNTHRDQIDCRLLLRSIAQAKTIATAHHFLLFFCLFLLVFFFGFCRFDGLIWMCAKRLTRNRRISSLLFFSSSFLFDFNNNKHAHEKLQKKGKEKKKAIERICNDDRFAYEICECVQLSVRRLCKKKKKEKKNAWYKVRWLHRFTLIFRFGPSIHPSTNASMMGLCLGSGVPRSLKFKLQLAWKKIKK